MAAEFEGWAIVELMGHRKLAGYVREVTVAGAAMLRLEIPSEPPVTQFYSAGAVYAITPTTEDIARRLASTHRPAPVHAYELPAPKPDDRCRNCAGSGCSDCGYTGKATPEPDYEDVEF